MAGELDLQLNAIMAGLTAPGAPFETVMVERGGVAMPAIRNAPPHLPALFAHFCAQHGQAEFLVDGELRLSFAATHVLAVRAARGLIARHGVKHGDHIGIAARNSANWIIAYMAVLMAGGCATLINGWWTGGEMAEAIALGECTMVLADSQRADRLTEAGVAVPVVCFDHGDPATGLAAIMADEGVAVPFPELSGEDRATILFTSGSTGQSKAALSQHRSVVQAAMNYAAQSLMALHYLTSIGEGPKDQPSTLLNLPLFHVTAEVPVLLQSFIIGRKTVLMAKWDAIEAMRLIEAERINYFVGVPLMSYEIATHPDRSGFDLSSCRTFVAGGAPRPADHVEVIRKALPHGYPMLGYGLTETNGVGCVNFNQNYLAKPESTGFASLPLVELAILGTDGASLPQGAVGEVAIRSIANFSGYFRNAEATAAALRPDGFFLTGDLGYLDDAGYLFVVDRKKDIIIRGGENISCIEVEQALYAHPDVAEASVFGLPDERFGELPVAVWHRREGAVLDDAALAAFVTGRIAPFKLPVHYWREDSPLPRLGTEKVDKRALKARYSPLWESARPGA